MQEFYVVGGYKEDLEKPQNYQNQGVGACARMGACPRQYGTCHLMMYTQHSF